jgi:hypothetical protein
MLTLATRQRDRLVDREAMKFELREARRRRRAVARSATEHPVARVTRTP